MAQKLFLIEASLHEDILASAPIAGAINEGYEVAAMSGFSTLDNKPMCCVLLSNDNTVEVEETP